ncbi:MAG: haloacid dehalogenase-like hydrolase [Acidimicrobiia bacterium]|nr:haloacid dehalogenase-like hydrolase [Acidimicrobiia bacterium]
MENTPTLRELPSWRSGDNLDALWGFLEQSQAVPTEQRVAVFDNDGTLWCERPTYNQVSFVIWFVEQRMKNDRGRQLLDDLQTLLQSGSNLLKGLNAQNIVQAVNHLFEGLQPHEFADLARAFAERWRHPDHGELRALRYQPMLELIAALRRRDFTVFLVTGVAPTLSGRWHRACMTSNLSGLSGPSSTIDMTLRTRPSPGASNFLALPTKGSRRSSGFNRCSAGGRSSRLATRPVTAHYWTTPKRATVRPCRS